MTGSGNTITDFSPHLFWDMPQGSLDTGKHKRIIVERVIQRGSRKDIDLMQAIYDKEAIKNIIKEIAWLDEKDMAFVHVFFNIPFSEMKCYIKRQSVWFAKAIILE